MMIPIRTKVMATLLSLTLAGLGAALFTSRTLFEKDKTAYLFDMNQETAETKAIMSNSILQQWFQALSPLSLYIHRDKSSLGDAGEILFSNMKDLRALVVTEPSEQGLSTLVFRDKSQTPGLEERLKGLLQQKIREQAKFPVVEFSTTQPEVLIFSQIQVANQQGKSLYLAQQLDSARTSALYANVGDTRHMLLDQSLSPKLGADRELLPLWDEILSTAKLAGLHNISQMMTTSKGRFLVSFAKLNDFDFYVASVTPEAVITRVLRDLSVRTLYVALLVAFIVLGASVLISKNLTANIEQLMVAVNQVASGDFNIKLEIKSRDETGLLASGFRKMSTEIHRLLHETAQKSRMESELKTAQAVQATLFPEPVTRFGEFEIAGHYRSASECGGDWWYYKQQGDSLYIVIADATGHGAPAALITSAARSAFSVTASVNEDSAVEVARLLNRAIHETSKGRLLMTGLILRLQLSTGQLEAVNCSHEPMFRLPVGEDGKPECLLLKPRPRLGEKADLQAEAELFQLDPGQVLCLYTDGIPDVTSPEGKSFGERRFLKSLAKTSGTAAECVAGVVKDLDSFNKGTELVDDVTLVLVSRSGRDA